MTRIAFVQPCRASTVSSAGLIHVNGALGLRDNLGCFWQFVRLRDLEQSAALSTSYPSVGCAAVELPNIATLRTSCYDLHRCIPLKGSKLPRVRSWTVIAKLPTRARTGILNRKHHIPAWAAATHPIAVSRSHQSLISPQSHNIVQRRSPHW